MTPHSGDRALSDGAGIWPDPAPHPAAGYLDAVGGQPVLPVASRAMLAALEQGWSDPARLHHQGRRAGLVLDTSRAAIAAFLEVPASECFVGSSGSDVLRAAVAGLFAARTAEGAPPRILISAVESMAVTFAANSCPGAEIVTIPVDSVGTINTEVLERELAQGAAIACLQQANAEVGTVQPVAELHGACRSGGVPMVSEAIQVAGHRTLGSAWDACVVVPRDWGGPPGCGVLLVKSNVRWRPPEAPDRGWVGGFPDIAAAAASAAAAEYVGNSWLDQARVHASMIDRIRAAASGWAGVHAMGDPHTRLPHIVTLIADGVIGEQVVTELDRRGIAVASGSACTADARMPSHVLEAMGAPSGGSLRVSLPYACTLETIDDFIDALPLAVAAARG